MVVFIVVLHSLCIVFLPSLVPYVFHLPHLYSFLYIVSYTGWEMSDYKLGACWMCYQYASWMNGFMVIVGSVEFTDSSIRRSISKGSSASHKYCFSITSIPFLFQLLCLLRETQLPNILPPDGGRYELQVLHLDYGSIIPYLALRACWIENAVGVCISFKLICMYYWWSSHSRVS